MKDFTPAVIRRSPPPLAHLLLITALVMSLLGLSTPLAAHHADAHDHAATAGHEVLGEPGDGQDNRAGKDSHHPVAHVCPGCAIIAAAEVVEPGAPWVPLQGLATDPALLLSIHNNPIPPPPRRS
jgi:hypothetical protein